MSDRDGNSQEERRSARRWQEGTLDFIYEHTKEGPNLQFEDSKQLDSKITAVFAARLPNTEGPQVGYRVASWSGHLNAVDAFFYLAVAAWGVVAIVTLSHLSTKTHRRAVRADLLWTPKYRYDSPTSVKRRVVVDIREAYRHNKELLDGKAKTFNRAAFWAAAEGAFLVLALVLARAAG